MSKGIKMKILLVAVNAKYIHSCPAVYSLKAYADKYKKSSAQIEIAEYTINDRYGDDLSDIIKRDADVIAFSTYIWNVERVLKLISDIRKIKGRSVKIWVGGPESTNAPEKFLVRAEENVNANHDYEMNIEKQADVCILGEGEQIFTELVDYVAAMVVADTKQESINMQELNDIPESGNTTKLNSVQKTTTIETENKTDTLYHIKGLALPTENGIQFTGNAPIVDMDKIPFLYNNLLLFDNRIIYYESSRGCPFNCSYCLSSIDRKVRFRNIEIVKKELQFFLDNNVRQVKFVDRTFNCSHHHAGEIWKYINEHDNGITNFHFEIEAALITDEEIAYLKTLRPGLIQMEIGIQSTNEKTLKFVNRKAEIDKIEYVVRSIREKENINIHLDLIAGLPYEDMQIFEKSFNRVYNMRSDQFQLGFLKVLKGTEIQKRCEEFGIISSSDSPYQVLATKWMSYGEFVMLEQISDMIEIFYNSRFFIRSLPYIEKLFDTPFEMYKKLAEYYIEKEYNIRQPAAQKRYDIMRDFVHQQKLQDDELQNVIENYIGFDKALHFNKSRHMECRETFQFPDGEKTYYFNYRNRNPVNGEAEFYEV